MKDIEAQLRVNTEALDRQQRFADLFWGRMTLEQFCAHVDERDRRLGRPWAKGAAC